MAGGGILVREIFVDFNHVGWTGKVRARLLPEEREGLSVGEVVPWLEIRSRPCQRGSSP
jgi:hypothetical protein